MRAGLPLLGVGLWVLPLLLFPGCAAGPPATAPILHPPYFLSRDGNVRYRLPAGWFDVTVDSQMAGRAIWLVRNDYAGTLTMHEVHIDSDGRKGITRNGLLTVARLTAALEMGSKGGVLAREPERVWMNGREGYAYDIEYGSGDRTRTIMIDTGEHVYEVSALVNAGVGTGARGDVYAVLQAFVALLRW
jgi:hypothetical protein